MGKYANHEEFGVNAPVNYREDTTSECYLKGMSVIVPPIKETLHETVARLIHDVGVVQ